MALLTAVGCAAGLAVGADANAQTSVRMHLTRILSPEETTGLRVVISKGEPERPYFECEGDETKVTFFVALFEGNRMVLSRTNGAFTCGGRTRTLSADAVFAAHRALPAAVQGESKAAAGFIPGDEFLSQTAFSTEDYRRGSVAVPLSRELRVDLSRRSWYLVTVVGTENGQRVLSTAWVVLDRQ